MLSITLLRQNWLHAKISKMKVAIQGQIGSFHDEAAKIFFGEDIEILPSKTFTNVFEKVNDHSADFGVAAVENSLFGSIHETYDQLIKNDLTIIGEVSLPIKQQLVALPGVNLAEIDTVMSHPAALDQCRFFLHQNLPNAKLIAHEDTAGAIKEIKDKNLKNAAGIGSEFAANLHQMTIIAKGIEDAKDNVTRFVALSSAPQKIPSANKASLIVITPHQPGGLLGALKSFADVKSNLTKIESRPVRGEPFRYQFIIDAEASQDQLITLVHSLEQQGSKVKVLGHYKADNLE